MSLNSNFIFLECKSCNRLVEHKLILEFGKKVYICIKCENIKNQQKFKDGDVMLTSDSRTKVRTPQIAYQTKEIQKEKGLVTLPSSFSFSPIKRIKEEI